MKTSGKKLNKKVKSALKSASDAGWEAEAARNYASANDLSRYQ